jgi:hypothetical protein
MLKRIFLIVALVAALPLGANALEVGVRGRYWFPKLSAEITLDTTGAEGTKVDFMDDLGVENESFPALEVFAGIGSHHLSLSAFRVSYEGEKKLSQDIVFGGETFTADTLVSSELDFTMADLAYQYDLLDLENVLAGFSFGPVLQVKYLSGEASVKESTGTLKADKSFKAFIPTVGLGAHIGLLADWAEARARVTGLGFGGNRLVDGYAEVVVTPFPLLDIGVGYRYIKMVVDRDDLDLDVGQAGPYAMLALSW